MKTYNWEGVNPDGYFLDKLEPIPSALPSFQKLFQVSATALRSEERFSRNAETDLVCRLLLEKKKQAEECQPAERYVGDPAWREGGVENPVDLGTIVPVVLASC